MRRLAFSLGTVLGIGYFPVAPGTVATIFGIGLFCLLQSSLVWQLIVILGLLALSIPACNLVEARLNQKDPGILVIDEVVGILIGLLGLPLSWPIAIVGFFLFRAFDMFKIYPINRLEALPGGYGIMLDDVMAGLYTNLSLHMAMRYAGLI